jgi:methylated-DNA-[protein]-cysteine S-methyltransferase
MGAGIAPPMPDRLEVADVATPIGTFQIVYRGETVHLIDLLEKGVEQSRLPDGAVHRRGPFPKGSPPSQLAQYFRGERTVFELGIEPFGGTAFDRKVWETLQKVPAGSTITYGELAKRSGHPGAARAVGGSMRRNPIPIVVPCHRVIGIGGTLTGYGLGLWRKRWLLDREGAWPLRSGSIEGPKGAGQRTLEQTKEPEPEGAPAVEKAAPGARPRSPAQPE